MHGKLLFFFAERNGLVSVPAMATRIRDSSFRVLGFESHLVPVVLFACNRVYPTNNRTPQRYDLYYPLQKVCSKLSGTHVKHPTKNKLYLCRYNLFFFFNCYKYDVVHTQPPCCWIHWFIVHCWPM